MKDKRDLICQDYGSLLEECGGVLVEKRQSGVLFGTRKKNKWEDGGEWKWYKNDDNNRYGRYKGEIENGRPNGQGTVKTVDGLKYVGQYKDGEKHGKGTYTWSDGGTYLGNWKDGKEHGQGTYTSPVGTKYVGEWKEGKPWNGTGYDKDGNIIEKFVNGEWIKQ